MTARQEQELFREEIDTLSSMLRGSFTLSYLHDLKGNFIAANASALRLLGYTKKDIPRLNFASLIDPGEVAKTLRAVSALRKKGYLEGVMEYRLKTSRGNHVWVEAVASIVKADGRPYAVQGLARDITDIRIGEMVIRAQRDIALVLGGSVDLGEAAARVLEIMAGIEGIDGGGVYLVDGRTGSIDLAAHRGLGEDFIQSNAHFSPDSARGRYIRSGKKYQRDYQELREMGDPHYLAEGFRSLLVVPVMHRGTPVAVLNCFSRTLDRIPAVLAGGIESVAYLIGASIARIRADRALRESKENFRSIVETTTEWIWEMDLEGRHTYSNPGVTPILGYLPEEIIGNTIAHIMHEEDLADVRLKLPDLINAKRGWRGWIVRWRHRDGGYRFLESNAEPILDSAGRLSGYRGSDRDITDRRLAAEALRESEERLRLIADNLPDGLVYQVDSGEDGSERRFSYVSAGVERLHGITAAEAMNNPSLLYESFVDDDGRRLAEREETALKSMSHFSAEARVRMPSGEIRWRLFTSSPRRLSNNHLVWDGIEIDITERKMTEEALQREKERAQKYLDIAGVMIIAIGRDGNIILANRKACHVLGYQESELVGKNWFDIALPEHERTRMYAVFNEIMAGNIDMNLARLENTVKTKAGEERLIAWSNTLIKGSDGRIEATLSSGEDVTEQKRAEDAMRKSEQLFRALIEHSYDAVTMLAADGTILYDSPSIVRVLGYAHDERVGKSVFEYALPEERGRMKEGFRAFALENEGFMQYQGRFMHRDGSTRWIEGVRTNLLHDPLVEAIVVNYRDITGRKRAEKALRESEEKYRALFDDAAEGIALMGLEDSTLSVNKSFAQMHGYDSPEDMKHVRLEDLDTPETARLAPERLKRILAGETLNFDVEHYHRDGHIIMLNVSCTIVHAEGKAYYMGLHQDITERKRAEKAIREALELNRIISEMTTDYVFIVRPGPEGSFELAWVSENFSRLTRGRRIDDVKTSDTWVDIIHPDDRARFREFMETTISDVAQGELECRTFSPDGATRHVQIFVRPTVRDDGTLNIYGAVKDITRRKMAEEQIERSLREKEILLQEVHHRVKNNLQTIVSLFNIQEDRIGDERAVGLIRDMRGKIYSMAQIHEMLYRSGDFSGVDMGVYVRNLIGELFSAYGIDTKRIALRVDAEGVLLGLRQAMPCGLLLHELVSNILKHAFPDGRGGIVSIAMKRTGKGGVEITVSDDGVGLPPEVDAARGGSMGLALVRGWAAQMRASLEVSGTSGTRFVIRMPGAGGEGGL